MIGIYKITNPIGQIYIGQSVNIMNRIAVHKYSVKKSTSKLNDSFLAYGFNNHVIEILQECDKSELNNLERYWQDLYDVLSVNGLNEVLNKSCNKEKVLSYDLDQKIRNGLKISAAVNKYKFRKKIIFDVEMGIYYANAKEASFVLNIKSQYLHTMLSGHNRNKTNLIYV